MATAATSLLGLALPVTGELSGTWGDTVNVSITALLDTAVAGTTTLSADSNVTLTTTTLAANQARQAIILCSGARTGITTITAPAQSKIYTIINSTTGGFAVKIVGVGPTTGVTIAAGTTAVVVWNGVDFVTASVTSTTGVLPVANGGTGLSSGTSGGVLAYTAAGTLASSAALAASALVIGGGAGAAPSTTTTGTGVVTALGVNTGTAGAFVVNGGALGTPSSGTVTNLTGTASININGTVGATTASTGAFTTLSATATGAYFTNNGVTTSAKYIQILNTSGGAYFGVESSAGGAIITGSTGYDAAIAGQSGIAFSGSNGSAMQMRLTSTALALGVGISLTGGTSGTGFSFSGSAPATSLTLDSSGNLGIGVASSGNKLEVTKSQNASTRVQVDNQNSGASALAGISLSAYGGNWTIDVPASTTFVNPLKFNFGATTMMTLDSSGNLGLGVAPSAWSGTNPVFEFGKTSTGVSASLFQNGVNDTWFSSNAYFNGTNWIYKATGPATQYHQSVNSHEWFRSTSAQVAGTDPVFTQAMTLDASSRLLVGLTSSLNSNGAIQVGGFSDTRVVIDSSSTQGIFFTKSGADNGTYRVDGSGNHNWFIAGAANANMTLDSSGNLTVSIGNVVIGTAGKGIDFSATSSGSGTMTSELLADYEEGTWTPNQGVGLTVVGTYTPSGTYTKIGRSVTVIAVISATTSIAFSVNSQLCSNLPFQPSTAENAGILINDSRTASQAVSAIGSSSAVQSSATQTAISGVTFTITYFV